MICSFPPCLFTEQADNGGSSSSANKRPRTTITAKQLEVNQHRNFAFKILQRIAIEVRIECLTTLSQNTMSNDNAKFCRRTQCQKKLQHNA